MDKPAPSTPFLPMFEQFRAELDEHHDRRERVIKASRDITAASKKIIFSLQRIRALNQPLPPSVLQTNRSHEDSISTAYASISADLQSLNANRYGRQISGGNQEFMEALLFQHYLTTQTLLSYDDARRKLHELGGEAGAAPLPLEDYVLGLFDMVGELMRFSITAMATNGAIPTAATAEAPPQLDGSVEAQQDPSAAGSGADSMDVDTPAAAPRPTPGTNRTVLTDMRSLRACLEGLDVPAGGVFAKDVDKKMDVMRTCVEKVEKGLYGLVVRGSERPKGWMPDLNAPREVEGF